MCRGLGLRSEPPYTWGWNDAPYGERKESGHEEADTEDADTQKRRQAESTIDS